MSPGEILNAAADAIEEHGWTQGRFGTQHVGFCAMGAMRHVSGLSTVIEESAAYDLLRAHVGSTSYWNDEPGRTKEQVVTVLRKVAAG